MMGLNVEGEIVRNSTCEFKSHIGSVWGYK